MVNSTAITTSAFTHRLSAMEEMNVEMAVMKLVDCVYLLRHCAMESQIVQTSVMNLVAVSLIREIFTMVYKPTLYEI